jgi:fructose-1,6-bisphosphatase I/sedoheptulose-1,7-bisphosphatase
MNANSRLTLASFLQGRSGQSSAEVDDMGGLILDVASACTAIARQIAFGELAVQPSTSGGAAVVVNVQGEVQKKLDLISNELFIASTQGSGRVAGLASEEMELPYQVPQNLVRGQYLLVFDPLDGSSNIDVNVSVGSIFSILRAPEHVLATRRDVVDTDFLQEGSKQLAAGYALYGPTTMFVLAMDGTVNGFTMDPASSQYYLTHPQMTIATSAQEFAVNSSNSRFWEWPVKRYVDECLAGKTGPRKTDFNMRWVASLVAETHRILLRGGVFLYPRDSKDPQKPGRLRLLYEVNPIGLIIEWAGGGASNGDGSVLDVVPDALHQRMGFIFGSKDEVTRIERYYAELLE